LDSLTLYANPFDNKRITGFRIIIHSNFGYATRMPIYYVCIRFRCCSGALRVIQALITVQNYLAVPKENDYFKQNSWSVDPLREIVNELHWRRLTNNPPVDAVIAGYGASRYYDLGLSDRDRIVLQLPYDFTPSQFSWPVYGIDVSLVETDCYGTL